MANNHRISLNYLDGIRGLAALYVALGHLGIATRDLVVTQNGAGIFSQVLRGLTFGRYAVAIFIVLSGYCLMMPVSRTPDLHLRGGGWAFMVRRARRILPPYYAALIISLALIALVPLLQQPTTLMWDAELPAFGIGSVLSHVALIHNLNENWIFKINSPLWSVATEWQIYFLLPLVFLPLCRRWGMLPVLAVGLVFIFVPVFVPGLYPASWWYVALFIFGMIAAQINFSNEAIYLYIRRRVPVAEIAVTMLIASLALNGTVWLHERSSLKSELWMGLFAACWITASTQSLLENRRNLPRLSVAFFSATPLLSLGAMSYSVYLLHQPVLSIMAGLIYPRAQSVGVAFGVTVFAGVPVMLAVCYLFHRIFERPFLSYRPRQEDSFPDCVKIVPRGIENLQLALPGPAPLCLSTPEQNP